NGTMRWRTFLGIDPTCHFPIGITSSATVLGGVVYVGGGGGRFYALSARNGSVAWSVLLGNTTMGYYNWASPLIFRGSAYVGLASYCEKPRVHGALLKIDLSRHAIVGRVNTTLNGSLGGGIWSSPAIDPATGRIFVTTGNPGPNASPYAEAILAITPSPFRIVDHWKVPRGSSVSDGDFGATPALFTSSTGAPMVAALNKNGNVYAWNRSALFQGPVWATAAGPGVAPGAVGEGMYYVGTGAASVGGVPYAGSLRAYRIDDGQLNYAVGLSKPVVGAPLWVNGLVVVGAGRGLELRSAANGTLLAAFSCAGQFASAPSVALGRLYAGCTDGSVLSWGLPLRAHASATPGTGRAPLRVAFSAVASAGVPTYTYLWSFGDGSPNVTARTTGHRYSTSGTFDATLTVTDLSGNSVQVFQTIHVALPGVASRRPLAAPPSERRPR
ncbi:MAG: PQQ-binding-like beta-propeller repeat protein, partial [Thermoplasmata archaeon]|nr:PQQ-binding-like beta-propeller repeat protein [Thermoplasmata archaeon]